MLDIFGLSMRQDYEDRKVARHEHDDLVISTAHVVDSEKPYETAVAHSRYNEGKLIIVEDYWTEEEALKGHMKWIKKMKNPLSVLKDISTAFAAEVFKAIGGETVYERGKT